MANITTLSLPVAGDKIGAGVITFSWAENVAATGYQLEILKLDNENLATIAYSEDTTALTLDVTLPEGAYIWRITCETPNGRFYGEERTLFIRPTITAELPSDLVVEAVDATSATITFTPVTGITNYEYRVDGGTPVAITASAIPVTKTGLEAQTEYTIGVRSVLSYGKSSWVETTVTTPAAG